jgi:hypothetical protein
MDKNPASQKWPGDISTLAYTNSVTVRTDIRIIFRKVF